MPWGFAIVCIIVLSVLGYIFWPESKNTNQSALNDSSSTNSGNQATLTSSNDSNNSASLTNAENNRNSQLGNQDNSEINNNSGTGNNKVNLPAGMMNENNNAVAENQAAIQDKPLTITMGARDNAESNQNTNNNNGDGSSHRPVSNTTVDNTNTNGNSATDGNSSRVIDDGINNLTGNSDVKAMIDRAAGYAAQNELVMAREIYNIALHDRNVGSYFHLVQQRLTDLNETLIFSNSIISGDPYVERHVIKNGDRLIHLARDMKVDWRFLARINGISDPGKIRLGQTIKLVKGPFHAVIDKSDFRMDVYIGQPDTEGRRMYVRSFPVGLGEFDSTPVGEWVVKPASKLIDPPWRNPRTGEYFSSTDLNNPIGERWIGLKGLDPQTELMSGYGIHGTIDPESIGEQRSMGCIRMKPDDIILVYEMLTEDNSSVYIRN